MSVQLDAALESTGTRFRLFPQPRFLPAFSVPEIVTVSVSPSVIKPGPEDDRMFAVDAVNKKPYGAFGALNPQQVGQRLPAVKPGPDGHFDHVDPDSREFTSTSMYATCRRTLDIWQDYHGDKIEWFFRGTFQKLLLIPAIEWDNAQSGFGFLEFGFGRKPQGGIDHDSPYCLNFDVLAHELGHNILFTLLGVPEPEEETLDYGGAQEGFADVTAIVALLHFDTVVDHILANSKGNLFSQNELSRMGELKSGESIRTAFNDLKMSDVGDEPHDRSEPLAGGVFDVFVEVFQKELVSRSLITQQLADRSNHDRVIDEAEAQAIAAGYATAYAGHEDDFKAALQTARDYLGRLLAKTWFALNPNSLTYSKILLGLIDADQELTGGANATTIRECLEWREIVFHPPFGLMIRRLSDCGMNHLRTSKRAILAAATVPTPIKKATTQPRAYIEGSTSTVESKPKKKKIK